MMVQKRDIVYGQAVLIKVTIIEENGNRVHRIQALGKYDNMLKVIDNSAVICPEIKTWKQQLLYWIDDEGEHMLVDSSSFYWLIRVLINQVPAKIPQFVLQSTRAQSLHANMLFSVEKK